MNVILNRFYDAIFAQECHGYDGIPCVDPKSPVKTRDKLYNGPFLCPQCQAVFADDAKRRVAETYTGDDISDCQLVHWPKDGAVRTVDMTYRLAGKKKPRYFLSGGIWGEMDRGISSMPMISG